MLAYQWAQKCPELGSIRCQHNVRRQHLSQIKDASFWIDRDLFWAMKNAAGYHPGPVPTSTAEKGPILTASLVSRPRLSTWSGLYSLSRKKSRMRMSSWLRFYRNRKLPTRPGKWPSFRWARAPAVASIWLYQWSLTICYVGPHKCTPWFKQNKTNNHRTLRSIYLLGANHMKHL